MRLNDLQQENNAKAAAAKRGSIAGRAWGGVKRMALVATRGVPREEIASGWGAINSLIGALRDRRGQGRRRVGLHEDNRIDFEATAFLHGMSMHSLDDVLRRHRKETARAAYLSFGLGWAFFLAWLYQAATTPWTWHRAVSIFEFAPFCLYFFLVAFRSALQNYQIRIGRLASAREYLEAESGFWPS